MWLINQLIWFCVDTLLLNIQIPFCKQTIHEMVVWQWRENLNTEALQNIIISESNSYNQLLSIIAEDKAGTRKQRIKTVCKWYHPWMFVNKRSRDHLNQLSAEFRIIRLRDVTLNWLIKFWVLQRQNRE